MSKVKVGNSYVNIKAVYSGSLSIAKIYDGNGNVVFSKITQPETVRINYYDEDGQTLLDYEIIEKGGNGANAPSPTKTSTAQYNYTFAGWTTTQGSTTVDANAIIGVTSDEDVYAVYTATTRTYTVTFMNENTIMDTQTVAYGNDATYSGTIPTKTSTATTDYVFTGWLPAPTNIENDTICYAQYYEVTQTITDSWTEIAEHVGTGDYTTRYSVGDTKFLDLGSEGKVAMEIVGIDTDDLADNSGKAPITWVSKQLLKTAYKMYPSSSGYAATWASSTMRTHLREDIFSLLPTEVQSSIKEVKKYTNNRTGATTWSTVQSNETVWIPSYKEIGGASTVETSGITYNTFTNSASRERVKIDTASKMSWWLRSASTNSSSSYQSYFCGTTQSGAASSSGYQCYYSYGVALGFCTGVQTHTVYFYNGDTLLQTVKGVSHGGTATYTGTTPTKAGYIFSSWSPSNTNITADTDCYAQFVEDEMYESISDSWAEVISNIDNDTYSTKYHVGDTKKLNLGTEGQVIMQLVGIDVDKVSNSSNYAPLTWISKQLLTTLKPMYNGSYQLAQWNNSDMRSYLTNTILPIIPSEVQNRIKWVDKQTQVRVSELSSTSSTSSEQVWIPSFKEIGGTSAGVEEHGVVYSTALPIPNFTKKKRISTGTYTEWWLRSASTTTSSSYKNYFCYVYRGGGINNIGTLGGGKYGIALGFCLGKLPYTINYYSQDGQTLIHSEQVEPGANGVYNSTPTKPSTTQYEYTFVGWAQSPNSTSATPGITENIQSNKNVYAAYEETARTYTVYFYNGDTLLQTVNNISPGGNATYIYGTPTKASTATTEYVFWGWSPSCKYITADTYCYAQFYPITQNITDSWREISEHIKSGDYTTRYHIGDTKILDTGAGKVAMQIVGIDTDVLSNNSGKAPITWISKQLLLGSLAMKSSTSNYLATWETTSLRNSINNLISNFPTDLAKSIKQVKKYTNYRTSSTTWKRHLSNETVWIPSYRELMGTTNVENIGIDYTNKFTNNLSRAKIRLPDYPNDIAPCAEPYWLRSASNDADTSKKDHFYLTSNDGQINSTDSYYTSHNIAIGFCTGVIQEYTVYFYNDDNTLLQTVNGIASGGTATYTGNTPISSIRPDDTFSGWLPSNTNITADTSCYAQFTHDPEITDSWATISARSAAGTAENYYAVGDYKTIHLGGTMGTVTLNMDVYVYILGFNHNSALEGTGITFGGFKRADVTQENIVLIDAQYGNQDATNLQYFNMSHNRGTDSIYGHNYGGWKGCDMRYDILGSTNVAPSEYGTIATVFNIGGDASPTCATSPVSNTLMSCLPNDLRTVMKPITKYTDNTGNASNAAQNVTSSVDYLPLLSEFEIFGQRSRANLYEQNYQEQYDYYANSNNSKIKDKYSSMYEASIYWTRSPYYNNSTNFAYVSTSGSVSSAISGFSYGVSPIFLV